MPVTFPVMRVVAPSASTVMLATSPSFSFETSDSPTVPCSCTVPVLARRTTGVVVLDEAGSPTVPLIACTIPALGARSVA